MILMSGGLHLYTRHLAFTAVDRPTERHLLCACVHNTLHQGVAAVSGGSLIRFKIDSLTEYQGAGLGTRKSVKLDTVRVLNTWSVDPSPAAQATSPTMSSAQSATPTAVGALRYAKRALDHP